MPTLRSAQPSPELRPYVRAYAQRKFDPKELFAVEAVPALLEQVLNFELGAPVEIRHSDGRIQVCGTTIAGAQTRFAAHMHLPAGVESLAIFFQPAGWSQLFAIPMREITNHVHDATSVLGPCLRALWNRLGESSSFEHRVAIVEQFLRKRLGLAMTQDGIAAAATHLFRQHGAIRIADLAQQGLMGLRQFERRFQQETGASPKVFARVARFQAALDAKLSSPNRTWLDIAHTFGYFDQMHMIHDFERLGRSTPTQIIAQLGDVRPPALASAGQHSK